MESLENRAFAISIGIVYADGTSEPCFIQFNPDVDQWQTMSFTAAPSAENRDKVIDYINIYVVYYNQANTAYFDDVMVTLDETGTAYTYDEKGNLITSTDNAAHQTSYDIDEATNLVKELTDSTKTTYKYFYDTDNARKLIAAKESSEIDPTNVGYVYTYGTGNNSSNITSVTMGTVSDSGAVDGSKSYIKPETAYTDNGAFIKSKTDQRGNTVSYTLDDTTGQIRVVTDPLNNKTGYVYDDTTRYLNRVNAWNASDQLVSSVFYDYFAAEYGGLLRRIRFSDDYYYNFVYNGWGNLQSVRINNTRELVTRSYNSNNGSLKKSTYGNGQVVEFEYDGYGRLSAKKAANTSGSTAVQTSAYVYDALSRLSRVKDYVNGDTILYQYDIAGRLLRQVNGQGSFLYRYDSLNRPERKTSTTSRRDVILSLPKDLRTFGTFVVKSVRRSFGYAQDDTLF